MKRAPWQRVPWQSLAIIVATAAAYYGLDRGVMMLLRVGTDMPPLHGGAGLALAALWLYGPIAMVGIGGGTIAIGLFLGLPPAAMVGTVVGQCCEAGLGYWFLRRLRVHPRLANGRSVLVFITLVVLLPTSLNASLSTASSYVGRVSSLATVPNAWWSLWRSHALGILVVTPALLMLYPRMVRSFGLHRLRQARTWAMVLWLVALGLSGWCTIAHFQPSLPWLEYVPFLLLVISLVRFGQRAGILSGVLLVLLATGQMLRGQGWFIERAGNLSVGMTGFQAWAATMMVIALLVGAALAKPEDREIADREIADREIADREIADERSLSDVAARIRSSLNVAAILQQAVEEVRLLLNTDRVCLYQINAAGECVVTAESVIDPWPSAVADRIPPPIVIQMQQICEQNRLLVINSTGERPMLPFIEGFYKKFQIRASLNMSLVKDGVHFGMLAVHECRGPRHWQPHEIALIEQLVPQVELAVQQGLRYEALQDHARTMEQEVADRTSLLRQNMEELVDLNQSKDRLLHAVNHDLRTPAMGMLMVLHRLAMQSGDSISLPKSILETMIESTNHQISLIQSLLNDYNHEESLVEVLKPLAINDLVNICIDNFAPLILTYQATIDNQIAADLPWVCVDQLHLQRVFQNLITNALLHSPSGVKITLTAVVQPEQGQLRCTIADDGIGLTAIQCEDLFQRPYLRSKYDARLTGIGLGLFLARQVIQAHGGEIGVDTQPDQGAAFWLTLPLAESP
jgi:signal transduction histidine kinase/integral membrane sensor domain MASE1